MTNFFSYKGLQPVGIAIDGHIIWGPYKDDGTQFSACDLDPCNGFYAGGFYGYAATSFYPYGPACFGGANSIKGIAAQCSSNSQVCYA